MKRTTIMLPDDVKRQAEQNARESGISFAQFVRKSIESELNKNEDSLKCRNRASDSLFIGLSQLSQKMPLSYSDASTHHDEYLYGPVGLVAEDPAP